MILENKALNMDILYSYCRSVNYLLQTYFNSPKVNGFSVFRKSIYLSSIDVTLMCKRLIRKNNQILQKDHELKWMLACLLGIAHILIQEYIDNTKEKPAIWKQQCWEDILAVRDAKI